MKKSYKNLQNNIRSLQLPKLEAVKNSYSDRDYTVRLEFPEFTCVCPKTGLPDFATIYLDYVPDKLIVELKSFKLYLVAFRNMGIFHENVVNKILDDFLKTVKPRQLNVSARFGVRGGISTTVSARYPKENYKLFI